MKDILCLLGFHKYSKWESAFVKNNYSERLKRRCKNCGKLEFYEGFVNVCIQTEDKTPYIFKD